MRKRMKDLVNLILLFMVLSVVLFFNGCKQKQETPQVKELEEIAKVVESTKIPEVKKPTVEKQFKIAGIVFQEDQFMRLVQLGIKAAAEKSNVDLKLGNSLNSLSTEISLIDTYIAEKVDAIVITPLSTKGSVEALKRASEKGIKVITFNTDIDADFKSTFAESDQVELGSKTGIMAGQYIKKNLGGKAKIAMLEFMSLAPEQSKGRIDGFKSGINSIEEIQIEIVTEQDAWLAPQATNVVENVLTAHSDVNIIWAANEGGTVGAVTAVNNKGKAGQVVVFGTDMSKQLASFLLAKDGVLQGVTGQQPFLMGTTAIESAIKVLNGDQIPKKIIVPSVSYSRNNPDEINSYLKSMEELEKK